MGIDYLSDRLYNEDFRFSPERPYRLERRRTPAGARGVAPHFHESLELLHFPGGCGKAYIDGQAHAYGPETILVAGPNRVHAFEFGGPEQEYLMLRVDLDLLADLFRGCLLERGVLRFADKLRALAPAQKAEAGFLSYLEGAPRDAPAAARVGWLLELERWADRFERSPDQAGAAGFSGLLSFFEARYAGRVSLDDLAGRLGLSRCHASRKFQEVYGCGFTEFLNRFRVRKAANLLRCTDRPAGEIAYAVGFSSPAYFTRIFRAECGCSPRELRRAGAASAGNL